MLMPGRIFSASVRGWRFALLGSFLLVVAAQFHLAPKLWGQEESSAGSQPASGQTSGQTSSDAAEDSGEQPQAPAVSERSGLNWLILAQKGGIWMIPIFAMSLLTATFVIERFIGLRRSRVLPEPLVRSLGQLGGERGVFDPRQAYRLCQQSPSAAANVIRAMLLKVGRPHSEVEHAVAQASEREADRLYSNVRWLNLAAAVAPLLGLLGTVSGMIGAFYETTQLAAGQNKANALAEGIYEALVTTLSGLCVAIVAAFFAHFFEGRIQSLFRQIDELLFNLLPQIERYEGRVRFGRNINDQDQLVEPAPASTPAATPTSTPAAERVQPPPLGAEPAGRRS